MRALAAAVLILASCSPKESTSLDEAYGPWKARNFILGQTFSGGATLQGSVSVDQSRDVKEPSDWFEISINGRPPSRSTGVSSVNLGESFRPGPNWIRLFSSHSRMGWEFNVDTRSGTRFAFTPKDKLEWEMTQTKDE